ncbi:hypothetical protein ACIBG6_05665 [Streptomyces sp. NPDC050842]|uniref:hypothetical protein n=1 Tax=Streptomyces sp. NPDC050842 TaxID=3365636 RepID=UPI0037A9A935
MAAPRPQRPARGEQPLLPALEATGWYWDEGEVADLDSTAERISAQDDLHMGMVG